MWSRICQPKEISFGGMTPDPELLRELNQICGTLINQLMVSESQRVMKPHLRASGNKFMIGGMIPNQLIVGDSHQMGGILPNKLTVSEPAVEKQPEKVHNKVVHETRTG